MAIREGFWRWLVLLFLSLLPPLSASQPQTDRREVRVVEVEGLGEDVTLAVRSAAQRALQTVVGSFIDSRTLLEKSDEIRDGIRRETLSIRSEVKEYSQGSIRDIEILTTDRRDGLVRVRARVTVRVEDFRVFISTITSAASPIALGTTAQLATERQQQQSKAGMLFASVLEPILSGKAVQVATGQPIPYSQVTAEQVRRFDQTIARWRASSILVMEIQTRLHPDYLREAQRVLSETGSWSDSRMMSDRPTSRIGGTAFARPDVPVNPNWDLLLTLGFAPPSAGEQWQAVQFLLTGVRSEVEQSLDKVRRSTTGYISAPDNALTVTVEDAGGTPLQQFKFEPYRSPPEAALLVSLDQTADGFLSAGQSQQPRPWHHLTRSRPYAGGAAGVRIFESRYFVVVMGLTDLAASKGRRVVVKLQ